MRYTVVKSTVQVLGHLWMGGLGAVIYTLNRHDLENVKNDDGIIDRDSLEHWLCSHSGDFIRIVDFSASLEPDYQDKTLDIPWSSEKNEIKYYDCFHSDDDY